MSSRKLSAGQAFPHIRVPNIEGGEIQLANPSAEFDWRLVVVYRGKHCPLCTNYLKQLNERLPELNALGVDVVAVSADSKDRALQQINEIKPNFEVGYDLSIKQMQALGLYVSQPRSAQESDRPFAEPGLFVINADGNIQIIDISNAPFARPDLSSLIMGLKFIRNPENNYPIRGTHQ